MGWIVGAVLAAAGALLAVGGGYLGFVTLPAVVDREVVEGVVLEADTIQLERFLDPPVTLHFKVYIFNVTNGEAVSAGAAVPQVHEVGPYVYKQFVRKEMLDIDNETITYREYTTYEFDVEESYPLTEDDELTVVNVPYNAILQGAEVQNPGSMVLLNVLLNQVFGANNNRPVFSTTVGDLLFRGIAMCTSPGILGRVACDQIRASAQESDNMLLFDDGSFSFSFFYHKGNNPTANYTVDRGLLDHYNLGEILLYDGQPSLSTWAEGAEEDVSVCNMLNGTDSAIFRPFVNRTEPLRAFNPDICRSVELRYAYDTEYEGIPAARFVGGEWLVDGTDECFCINQTAGLTRDDGCLYPGTMELYSCTGAHMVFSSPHFLFGDWRYRNGVIGLDPRIEDHQIFVDLEPNTGTIVRGAKRAQFSMFLRPIAGITSTGVLRPTLVPVLWVEDGFNMPEVFVDEIKSSLLRPVRLISILRATAMGLGAALALLGVGLVVRGCMAGPAHPGAPPADESDGRKAEEDGSDGRKPKEDGSDGRKAEEDGSDGRKAEENGSDGRKAEELASTAPTES